MNTLENIWDHICNVVPTGTKQATEVASSHSTNSSKIHLLFLLKSKCKEHDKMTHYYIINMKACRTFQWKQHQMLRLKIHFCINN